MAISAQIGTGNVAGVATAITAGGPGAIFWMWLSAILGMSTILQKPFWRKNTAWSATANTSAALRFTLRTVLTPKIGRGAGAFSWSGFFLYSPLDYRAGFHRHATQSNSIASAMNWL